MSEEVFLRALDVLDKLGTKAMELALVDARRVLEKRDVEIARLKKVIANTPGGPGMNGMPTTTTVEVTPAPDVDVGVAVGDDCFTMTEGEGPQVEAVQLIDIDLWIRRIREEGGASIAESVRHEQIADVIETWVNGYARRLIAGTGVEIRADERKRVEKEIASTMIDHEQHLQGKIRGFVGICAPVRVELETTKTWRRRIIASDYPKMERK